MNRKGEVDFLAHCFRRYASRPVRRVLDIACGTGPHLVRLADRGYQVAGLDLSPTNIEFLRQRLEAKGHRGEGAEQRSVLGLVPVRRELIRDRDGEPLAAQLDGVGGFEPGPEGVLRYFAPRAFKQATPDFVRRKIHFC